MLTTGVPFVYLLLALKRFYGGAWVPQCLRAFLVGSVYGMLVVVGMSVVLAASFFI